MRNSRKLNLLFGSGGHATVHKSKLYITVYLSIDRVTVVPVPGLSYGRGRHERRNMDSVEGLLERVGCLSWKHGMVLGLGITDGLLHGDSWKGPWVGKNSGGCFQFRLDWNLRGGDKMPTRNE